MTQYVKQVKSRLEEIAEEQHKLVNAAIIKAQNRHGSLRAAARALKIDPGYLQRLKTGEASNPSDNILRRLRLL